jgi:ribosomal subunit interface protein
VAQGNLGSRYSNPAPGASVQIQITNGHIKLTRLLRTHIEQRIGLALGRFAERIGTVNVKFAPGVLNGGAPEKLCRIEIGLRRKLSVEAAHADVFAAVDQAIDHATRSVSRVLDQESSGSVPPITPLRSPKR